jgi:hypothetical protein
MKKRGLLVPLRKFMKLLGFCESLKLSSIAMNTKLKRRLARMTIDQDIVDPSPAALVDLSKVGPSTTEEVSPRLSVRPNKRLTALVGYDVETATLRARVRIAKVMLQVTQMLEELHSAHREVDELIGRLGGLSERALPSGTGEHPNTTTNYPEVPERSKGD